MCVLESKGCTAREEAKMKGHSRGENEVSKELHIQERRKMIECVCIERGKHKKMKNRQWQEDEVEWEMKMKTEGTSTALQLLVLVCPLCTRSAVRLIDW